VRAEDVVVVAVERDIVLFDVGKQVIGSQHLRDLDQLVVVVLALEEGFLLENHACKHAAQRPDVE
jgi:hypothetical protein